METKLTPKEVFEALMLSFVAAQEYLDDEQIDNDDEINPRLPEIRSEMANAYSNIDILRSLIQNGEEVDGKNGGLIADCFDNDGDKEANAAFIVRAVNSHEALLEAAKKVCQDINWMLNNRQFLDSDVFEYLEKAIAQAEGK